jgi:hypothetical protein
VLWHFVLVQTSALNTGSLRAEFANAGVTTPDVGYIKLSGGVVHWNVITPSSDILLNASTDAVGAILNLSHVCGGGGGSGGQTSSISTTVHVGKTDGGTPTVVDNSNPAPLGSYVHDSANLTFTGGGTLPSGSTVYFSYFTNNDCTAPPADTTSVDVGGESSPASNLDPVLVEGPLGAGSYSYIAVFVSGDSSAVGDAIGDCEPFKVSKGDLQIRTDIHDAAHVAITSAVPLGSVVHDSATLSGAVTGINPDLTKISFTFFTNGTCANSGSPATNTGPDTVGSTNVARTADSASLGAGEYSYTASFGGDDNYNAVALAPGDCEYLKVNKGDLQLRTDIHNAAHVVITSANAGAVVHDSGTLSGAVTGFNPDLTKVSFRIFTNGTCTGNGTGVSNTGADTAGSTTVARSANSAALGVGDFSYRASFAGDNNYNAILLTSVDCEPLHVFPAPLTIGYWKTHMHLCVGKEKQGDNGCSTNGPFTVTYLNSTICSAPNTCKVGILGSYDATAEAAALGVFNANNCSNASLTDANAAACLAAQLLGAELNVKNGANPCICSTIKAANDALTAVKYAGPGKAITLSGSGYTRSSLIALKTSLDNYNNGNGCP